MFSCETTETVLAADEISVLGFSGNDVLALAQGSHGAVFSYPDDTTTDVTVDVVYDAGEVRFMDAEPKDDGSGAEPAIGCTDWVEVDGAFADTNASGDIMLQTSGSDGTGDDGVAWASQDPLGSWSAVVSE